MYYQPDPTWESFGVTNHQLFIEKFVVPAHFHAAVPEDVKKEYEVAEHMMALSYYHYPMYDSAFHKLLGIFEMAVKLRCKELDIPIERRSSTGKTNLVALNDLIKKLTVSELYPGMEGLMYWSKEFRNYFSHPNQYQLMGQLCHRGMITIVNIINQLFIPVDQYHYQLRRKSEFQTEMEGFQEIPLGLIHDEKMRILSNPNLLDVFQVGEDMVFAVSFEPILKDTAEFIAKGGSIENSLYFFQDIHFSEDSFTVFNRETQEQQEIKNVQFLAEEISFVEHIDALKTMSEYQRYQYYWAKDQKNVDKLEAYKLAHCWAANKPSGLIIFRNIEYF